MSGRRTPFREAAEEAVRSVMRKAARGGMSAVRLRAVLRASFATLVQSALVRLPKRARSCWYAAIRSVTGAGVRDLVDPRQQKLPLDVGPAARRRRPRALRKAAS